MTTFVGEVAAGKLVTARRKYSFADKPTKDRRSRPKVEPLFGAGSHVTLFKAARQSQVRPPMLSAINRLFGRSQLRRIGILSYPASFLRW